MKLLLDTHALLWWLDGDARLSDIAKSAIGNESSQVYVSAASAWEIATKARIGKLPGATEVAERFSEIIGDQEFDSPPNNHRARSAGRTDAGRAPRSLRPDAHRTISNRRSRPREQREVVRPFRRSPALVRFLENDRHTTLQILRNLIERKPRDRRTRNRRCIGYGHGR